MMKVQCSSCKYLHVGDSKGVVYGINRGDGNYDEVRPVGECRKRSPNADTSNRRYWPGMMHDDWCGEYEAYSGHSDTPPPQG